MYAAAVDLRDAQRARLRTAGVLLTPLVAWLSTVLAAEPNSPRQANSWGRCWLNLLWAENRAPSADRDPMKDWHSLALRGVEISVYPEASVRRAHFRVWAAATASSAPERRRLAELAAADLAVVRGRQWGHDKREEVEAAVRFVMSR